MSSAASSSSGCIRPGWMSSKVEILLFLILPRDTGTVLPSHLKGLVPKGALWQDHKPLIQRKAFLSLEVSLQINCS